MTIRVAILTSDEIPKFRENTEKKLKTALVKIDPYRDDDIITLSSFPEFLPMVTK